MNNSDHGLDPEWETIVENCADHSVMNKLMADVSLTTVGDLESMVKYGGPLPDGQTDDVEGNAINADPTPCISLYFIWCENTQYYFIYVEVRGVCVCT